MRMLLVVFTLLLISAPVFAKTLKVATWNIEHLRDQIREGKNPREEADFGRLARYAQILDADVIALQEVENLKAAAKVFHPAKYKLFIEHSEHTLRTGFAVRQGIPVVRNADLRALNVREDLPQGTDITITVSGKQIRLLSVHLKAGCWDKPLSYRSWACRTLKRQVAVIETWIDARAAEGTPFIVLGDWNRRFDAPGDEFWLEIDDGKPLNADLWRVTQGVSQLCWDREFHHFIDHIVFDRSSARWIKPYTFEEIVYQEDASFKKKLSDHCPIAVTLDVP